MPNATVRANARTSPETTDRRAVMGAILAAGAAVATAAVPAAANVAPTLSPVDRRVLDLWRRKRQLQASLDRLSDQMAAAEARMPEWARSGPKYVLAKGEMFIPGVDDAVQQVGWPEVRDLDQQPIDSHGRILARPAVEDLYAQFQWECGVWSHEEATQRLIQALTAHDERRKRQEAEQERTGYSRLEDQIEAGQDRVDAIVEEIERHMETSTLALAAILLFDLERGGNDEESAIRANATFLAIRARLAGEIAEDVDHVLADPPKEEAA